MLNCMRELEDKELYDDNINEFFDKINTLLGINVSKNIQTSIQWELTSLLIYLQNVRNLKNKNHMIKPKTYDCIYDIIGLTETFFSNDNLNMQYL